MAGNRPAYDWMTALFWRKLPAFALYIVEPW